MQGNQEMQNELKAMYDMGEAEASELFNMIMANVQLYNRKLSSLSKTRVLIEGIMNTDEFNDWDKQYLVRKWLKVDIVDATSVSIF